MSDGSISRDLARLAIAVEVIKGRPHELLVNCGHLPTLSKIADELAAYVLYAESITEEDRHNGH